MSHTRVCTVTVVASLAQFSAGLFLGWSVSMIPKLPVDGSTVQITANELSWILSLLKLGMAFGCVLSIFIVDLVGRKISILLTVVPTLFSWLIIILNPSMSNVYVARFIGGTASGIIFTCGTMYVTEISPPQVRGALCTCFILMDYCGNLLGYAVGLFGGLQLYSYVAMSLAMLQFAMFVWLPETPYYLLHRKRFGPAMDSLIFLRGSPDVAEEMDSIMKFVQRDSPRDGILSPVFHLISQSGGTIAILIGICTMTIQAFSGSVILMGYPEAIFDEIHDSQSQVGYAFIVLTTVQLISYALCISLVDRLGRRTLIVASVIGVTVCSFLLGVHFCIKENAVQWEHSGILVLVAILLYVVSISLGLAAIPFLVTNEIFPMYAKSTCVSFCFCVNYILSFVILRIWSYVAFGRNAYAAFWFISALDAFSILFLASYLPETKGTLFLQTGKATETPTKK